MLIYIEIKTFSTLIILLPKSIVSVLIIPEIIECD
jgi:hypothetical protein